MQWYAGSPQYVLALLQEQDEQVGKFAERCRAALAMVYSDLFPLNPSPQGRKGLMREFCNGAAIHNSIRAQLVADATMALAFVRVHYPRVDLLAFGKGLPPVPDGSPWTLVLHYDAAAISAKNIVGIVEAETNMIRQRRRGRGVPPSSNFGLSCGDFYVFLERA
jgi:hypothetical protein